MTPERWQQIKDVLATALEIAPAERASYLDHSCVSDASLRHDVEVLLLDEEKLGPQFLNDTALAAAAAEVIPEEASRWIGRRVGAYRILDQIGAGGMGEVYRAVRDDDEYQKQVALKLVRAGQDSGFVITRFKNERQILATLDHPNIARLLDGGTTEEGVPYLVMELIEGQPIAEYCDAHCLSISDRLRLFVQVCSAVQYAHQRLIIHRDIKPGNILVTSEGSPKLLDFGIAKILGFDDMAEPKQATLTAFRVLTPGYASPEQIEGAPMTTASDVYSLGVVLYELLTGRSPYQVATRSSQEVARAVCGDEPERPSLTVRRVQPEDDVVPKAGNCEELAAARASSLEKLQKRLSGDLDNIVLMALRKEPSRRYASVEQFAEDIRRHMEHVPVAARKDTIGYRTGKFVARHRTGVVASVAAVLALLCGLAITLHEAQIAREQRARAERRFNDVRKLANSLMFEVHDSIKDLPGATPARKLLVTRALEYLDSLSKEASGDLVLQRELAAAYDRVGDVLGYDGGANLGDFSGALQSYDKALAIREAAAAANRGDEQIQSDLLNDYFHVSFALNSTGDYAGALNELRKALPVAQRLAAARGDPKYQDWLAGFYWQIGNVLSRSGDNAGALENYRKATSIEEPVAGGTGANSSFRTHLAGDYHGLGRMLWRSGDTEQALEVSKKGVLILEQLSQADPNNATLREYLGESYTDLEPVLVKHGDLDQALEDSNKGLQIFTGLLAADPANWLARVNVGVSEATIGEVLMLKEEIYRAIPHTRRAIAIFEADEHKTKDEAMGQAEAYATLAGEYSSLANRDAKSEKKLEHLREARSWYQKSLGIRQPDNHGSLDLGESQRVAQELAKCDAALAKLTAQKTARLE
jgi:non-specific serine/threonine protein kinase/serine/threonine-protein kinase